ncbi:MAG: hypothetical protein QS748_09790 [Candidatus Endonucleobacter bathymodioli]|uniref:Uncharacterized protein n=1 Tax=Candidatus Endonucleibacter bathymodioli TaxID=539814 RepID=A0AA90SDL3_9GAMM|nr:hypothetical protein [Candidatus Endonucleobacter bathymodioli]
MTVVNRLSFVSKRACILKFVFFNFILSVIFPVCALGVGASADDCKTLTSIVVYGFTPEQVLLSSEHPERKQKMEDFMIGLSYTSKRNSILTLLEVELCQRPLRYILEYVEHHKLYDAANLLKEDSAETTMVGLMNKHYEKGGKAGLLRFMIDLFALEEYEIPSADNSAKDEFESSVEEIDDSEVQSYVAEITLFAIRARLKGICTKYNIKPALACQKGAVNKSIDCLLNGFSKMLITTGSALYVLGTSELVMSGVGVAADYLLHYRGHNPTCPMGKSGNDDCQYFSCDSGEQVDIATGTENLPDCLMIKSPHGYTDSDLCAIPVDSDNHARAILPLGVHKEKLAAVKLGSYGKPYTVMLSTENYRKKESAAVYGAVAACGAGCLIASGVAVTYYRKTAALERRIDKTRRSMGSLVSGKDEGSKTSNTLSPSPGSYAEDRGTGYQQIPGQSAGQQSYPMPQNPHVPTSQYPTKGSGLPGPQIGGFGGSAPPEYGS